MPLSREAIEKLRIVQEQILATPEFYDQNEYAKVTVTGTKYDTICCTTQYEKATTPKQRAKVAVARIEQFIEDHSDPEKEKEI